MIKKNVLLILISIVLTGWLLIGCAAPQVDVGREVTEASEIVEETGSTPVEATNPPTATQEPTAEPSATKEPQPTQTNIPTHTSTVVKTESLIQDPKETLVVTVAAELPDLLEPNGHALSDDFLLIDTGTEIFLTSPYFPYYINFPKGDFEVDKELHFSDDGNSVGIQWWDEDQMVGLSIFIEPVNKCNGSINCRDFIWSFIQEKPDSEKDDVEFSEYDDYAVLARTVNEYSGVEINQRHFNAELVRDDHWIDIHLSKMYFKNGDKKTFTGFLDEVEFILRSSFLMELAGNLYLGEAYELSLQTYNEVIALGTHYSDMARTYKLRSEVQERLGDYEAAVNDLLYAIELDDENPSYYNQVCWNYALINQPELALPYCNQAVEIELNPQYLDSRGLVYILLGDFEAALEDFQVVLAELEGSTDTHLQELYQSRKIWLEALERGENPITPEVLEALKSD